MHEYYYVVSVLFRVIINLRYAAPEFNVIEEDNVDDDLDI